MRCKKCKNEIPDGSIFCNWCGAKQLKRQPKDELFVPAPKLLASGEYANRVMVDGDREWIKGETEAEYYQLARAFKARVLEMKKHPERMPLDKAMTEYISANEAVLSPSTIRGYYYYTKQLKAWKDTPWGDIDWQRLVSTLSEKYAPKTVYNLWGFMQSVASYHKFELPDVKKPQAEVAERNFLDFREIQIFLEAIYGKPYELAALLALHSLRASEILALNKDSNKGGFIAVRGSMVKNKDNILIEKKTNKNRTSTRNVPVMIPRLQELWDQLDGDPVFPTVTNISEGISRVTTNNGLPKCTLHNLRHSFCSLAFFLKWDIGTTMAIGGWSDPKIPTEIYKHLSDLQKNSDVERMKDYYKNGIDLAQHFEVIENKAV